MANQVTAWDEHGNPVTAQSGATATAWDESGNPIVPTLSAPDAKISSAGHSSLIDQGANALAGEANYTPEGRAEHPVLSRVSDFMGHVREYGRLLGAIANTGIVPFGEMEPLEAPAAQAAEKAPGLVKQAIKGEKIAQPPAQAALRDASAAADARAASSYPAPSGPSASIREGLSNPIDISEALYKKHYNEIDQAAGTDIKALREKLANTEYNIRNLTDTEADQAQEAKLETARQGLIAKIQDAEKEAVANGVPPDTLAKADKTFQQTQALKDIEKKVFKNPNVVVGNSRLGTNETVNVNEAVKALQKLADDTRYGSSRLEQAFGKDASDNLLRNLYAAQKAGEKAVDVQKLAKWLLPAAVGGAAYAVPKAIDAVTGK